MSLMQPSHAYQQVVQVEEYKIVILGEGGVGKSSLTVRFCSDNFIDEYGVILYIICTHTRVMYFVLDPTVEDCYRKQAKIDGEDVLLEITDTAGQEEFQAMRDEWIRDGDGYLLVYSITLPTSFEELDMIRDRILQTNDCESAPIVIAGNKCDLSDDRRVEKAELDDLALKWDCPAYETSAKTRVNNIECFYQCVREIKRYKAMKENGGIDPNKIENTKQCNCCILL